MIIWKFLLSFEKNKSTSGEFSEFDECFYRPPALEQRAMAFYVKKECEDFFAKRFKQVFEKDYILFSSEQLQSSKLFGNRENHPRFKEMTGDFLAVAKSDLVLTYAKEGNDFPSGQHAGICDDEMMVPIILNRK